MKETKHNAAQVDNHERAKRNKKKNRNIWIDKTSMIVLLVNFFFFRLICEFVCVSFRRLRLVCRIFVNDQFCVIYFGCSISFYSWQVDLDRDRAPYTTQQQTHFQRIDINDICNETKGLSIFFSSFYLPLYLSLFLSFFLSL